MEWIEEKSNDKNYLLQYYQSRVDLWKDKSKKVADHFRLAVKKLKKDLNGK